CGAVDVPVNGQVENPEETTFQKVALFKCNIGYDLIGNDCKALSSPENGRVNIPSGTTYHQNATYTCNNGYELIGDRVSSLEDVVLTVHGSDHSTTISNLTMSDDVRKTDITEALTTLTAVTTTYWTDATTVLTDGEITALSGLLEYVAALLSNSTVMSCH
ncbi:hypothetical protein MAR_016869, partial [Mya arenaria]